VTEGEAIHPDPAAEVSREGKVDGAVGKAMEALHSRKAEQPIGRTGNDEWKARTVLREGG